MKRKFLIIKIMKYLFVIIGVLNITGIVYLLTNRDNYYIIQMTYNSLLNINFTPLYVIVGIIIALIRFLISDLMDWIITVENNQTIIIESLMQINHNITGIEAKQAFKNANNNSDTIWVFESYVIRMTVLLDGHFFVALVGKC